MRKLGPWWVCLVLAGCPGGGFSGDGGFGDVTGGTVTTSASGTSGADSDTDGTPPVPTDNLLGDMMVEETWSEAFLYGGEYGNDCADCREAFDMQVGQWSGVTELRHRMWYVDAGSSGQADGDQVCFEGYTATAVSTVEGYDPHDRVLVQLTPSTADCKGPVLPTRIVLQRIDTDPTGWPNMVARWATSGDGSEHWPGWATDSPLMGAVPLQACDPPTFSYCTPPCELGNCSLPPPPDPPPDPGTGTTSGTGSGDTGTGDTGTGGDTGTSTGTSG